MDRVERDDFMHALRQTMEFFGKELSDSDFKFWYSALGSKPVADIKFALKEHVKHGKFAPKPGHIMELLPTRNPAHQQALPAPEEKPCPPEIAAAWSWFIKKTTGWAFGDVPEPNEQEQERYLHIVNHEAKQANQPEAIPDQWKLAEVWG